MSENYVGIPASQDPADMYVQDWQRVQSLHLQGDEVGLLAFVQDVNSRAYQRGHADGAKKAVEAIDDQQARAASRSDR